MPNDTAPNDTDLPAAIRAALRDNEIDETDLRQPTFDVSPSHRSATRWAMGAAAAAVVVLGVVLGVTLPGHHSAAPPGPAANGHAAPGYVGYRWTVVSVRDRVGTLVPRGRSLTIAFGRDGRIEGNDGLNGLGGTYVVTHSGYTVRDSGSTLVGYAGHDRTVIRIETAVDAMFADHRSVRASTSSDRLRLQRGPYVLLLRRADR